MFLWGIVNFMVRSGRVSKMFIKCLKVFFYQQHDSLNLIHKRQEYGIANKRKKYNNILSQIKMSSFLWSVADCLADCWLSEWLASYITGLLSDWLKDYLPNWLTGERTAIYLWGLSLQEIRTLLWNLIPPWLTTW